MGTPGRGDGHSERENKSLKFDEELITMKRAAHLGQRFSRMRPEKEQSRQWKFGGQDRDTEARAVLWGPHASSRTPEAGGLARAASAETAAAGPKAVEVAAGGEGRASPLRPGEPLWPPGKLGTRLPHAARSHLVSIQRNAAHVRNPACAGRAAAASRPVLDPEGSRRRLPHAGRSKGDELPVTVDLLEALRPVSGLCGCDAGHS